MISQRGGSDLFPTVPPSALDRRAVGTGMPQTRLDQQLDAVSDADMIPRYTNPEMGAIWSESGADQTWLEVELAAADAMARPGISPTPCTRSFAAARPSTSRASKRSSRHPARRDRVHDRGGRRTPARAARWLHFGLTSSDVLDTALALQMRQACDLMPKHAEPCSTPLAARAQEHRRTPMIGRTHGVHAEPMTLGCQARALVRRTAARPTCVSARAEIVGVGKISGAVGMFAHLEPSIEEPCARGSA